MRCEDCLPCLEEYFDGEMSRRGRDQVTAHLAACGRCSAAFSSISAEQQIYSRYTRDVEVTPALWSAVQKRIATEKAADSSGLMTSVRGWIASTLVAPRLSPAAVVLLIAVAIAATIWLTTMVNTRNAVLERATTSEPSAPKEPTTTPSPRNLQPLPESTPERPEVETARGPVKLRPGRVATARTAPTPDQLVREAEQKYIAAIAILNRDVRRQQKRMDPEVVARLDDAIAGIDRTIADTRQALRQNPSDTLALEYMLTAYARKVDLLRDIANY